MPRGTSHASAVATGQYERFGFLDRTRGRRYEYLGMPSILRPFLTGADRRSQAQSARALASVRDNPALVSELAALVDDRDWLVSMRALDLLEKLAFTDCALVEPHKGVFIGPIADSDKWENRLQVVRALPRFEWTARQRRRAVAILMRDVEHDQLFVRAWALDGLATFAMSDAKMRTLVRRQLEKFERSRSKALAARARKIRERLKRPLRAT